MHLGKSNVFDATRGLKIAVLWPLLLGRFLYRWTGKAIGAFVLATRDSLICPGCHGRIDLVGRFKCTCGFVFDGFVFSRCEVCGKVPSFVACQECGVCVKSPLLFP